MNFLDYKHNFILKHRTADWSVDTSPMDKYGKYVKTYIFSDGAIMVEVNRPVWRKAEAEVEIEGVIVKISEDVKLLETEAWTNEDPNSVKFYEKW